MRRSFAGLAVVLAAGHPLALADRAEAGDPDPARGGALVRVVAGGAYLDQAQGGSEIEALGTELAVAAGTGVARPGLTVLGELFLRYLPDVDAEEQAPPRPDRLVEVGVGPGLSYRIGTSGVYAGAAADLLQVRGIGEPATGFQIAIHLGREWRVTDGLGLGIGGRASFGWAFGGYEPTRVSGVVLGLSASYQ